MRADRLLAILLLLQARGGMSAPELAEELEVSVRTVFRDLDALSAAGVPVYADRGAQGGIRLLEGYRTDLTGLSSAEAQSLFLLGIPGPLDDLGLASSLPAAERKLLAALPAAARRDAQRTRERLHIDPAGWDRSPLDITHLAGITAAVFADRRMRLDYTRGDNRRVQRVVDPLGMVLKGGSWYLVAGVDGQVRSYRVSRVRAATILDESFARPDDFDLAEFWSTSTTAFEAGGSHVEVRVRVAAGFIADLAWHVGEYVRPLIDAAPPARDGSIRIGLRFVSLNEARVVLLGMGVDVEVLRPVSLRRAIADAARTVLERYTVGRAGAPMEPSRHT